MKHVDYYFCLNSPWSLFASVQLQQLLSDTEISLRLKPVKMARLYSETGGLPLKQRSPQRQRYRLQELARWSEHLGLPIHLEPRYFPADEARAAALVITAEQEKGVGLEIAIRLGKMVWCQQADIADSAVLTALKEAFELTAMIDQSKCDALMLENTAELIEKGGFGVPTFITGEDVFWGQDRLNFLMEKLS